MGNIILIILLVSEIILHYTLIGLNRRSISPTIERQVKKYINIPIQILTMFNFYKFVLIKKPDFKLKIRRKMFLYKPFYEILGSFHGSLYEGTR